jgi:DNA-binding NtrC family response regulator
MGTFKEKIPTIELYGGTNAATSEFRESCALQRCAEKRSVSIPSGLVISGDFTMRGKVGETLLLCGVAPIFANSLQQATRRFQAGGLALVVCQDQLPDGRYHEVLLMQQAFESQFPLIVVSRTGDWPEYFEAIDLGARDFLTYPLIPGELQRIVRNVLQQERSGVPNRVSFSSRAEVDETLSRFPTEWI